MAKIKTAYFCSSCGYESVKWLGRCPSCNAWNTFVEEVVDNGSKKPNMNEWNGYFQKENEISTSQNAKKSTNLTEIKGGIEQRILSTDPELNRVLGGGIVLGSLVLVAGEPGIGKSTLFLQNALHLPQIKTLYVSGEESASQIKMRADRLESPVNENFYLLTNAVTQEIFKEIKTLKPQWVIIDSIQTMTSQLIDAAAGSISQIRECAAEFQKFAKETGTPVFLIGHITKDGSIAGPKILEHMVDTVLQFEGDRHYNYRLLRTLKNRFGSTSELGIYEMLNAGIRPVSNPSDILISEKEDQLSGSAIAASMEGQRPLLMEVQALVTQSVYGTPQRTSNGFDLRRLQLLLAVLEKRGGFAFGMKDVFVNIAGGFKVEDPSIDLAVIASLLSSFEDLPIAATICFAAEVGLSGEIRTVNRIEQRIAEAEKLGFEKIIVSKYSLKQIQKIDSRIQIIGFSKVEELYNYLFH